MSQVKALQILMPYATSMKRKTLLKIIIVAPMLAGTPATWANDNLQVSHGRRLVEANCARCHATGSTGESAHPDAPPFRTLHLRYPIEDLEEALAEGISTGHPDMPEFVADPQQIGAIVAYIRTLDR
ncbi:cytochrome c [Mesorhizobium sp. B2-4-6]|uniref:c-type cytochrome n=1 Tax=Mesorhizobium sp. B2-4-6 TaxID=2589943 RepID=UPI001129A88B|nr:cytochrome c [Mesorhizobium sp. B2-4-6]TPL43241.1 cytochrome c [Mesorhizobium sp. B2-4-6]